MAKVEKKEILVYAHWMGLADPARMGTLTVTQGKGKEVFSFEYELSGYIVKDMKGRMRSFCL